MQLPNWLRKPKVRRSLALASFVLSVSGLYLVRANAGLPTLGYGQSVSATRVAFAGAGAHGTLGTSQSSLAPGGGTFYAELDIEADARPRGGERAPLSLAVVLDTSGSMSGEKMDAAKVSVRRTVS